MYKLYYEECPYCGEWCHKETLSWHLKRCKDGYSALPACPQCGYRDEERGDICPQCGTYMGETCPLCGGILEDDGSCLGCGATAVVIHTANVYFEPAR